MMEKEKFARDKKNSALLNVDNDSYAAYKAARNEYYRFDAINRDVQALKTGQKRIEELLQKLISSGKING